MEKHTPPEQFSFFSSYYDAFRELDPKEQHEFYDALFAYVFVGTEPDFASRYLRMAWKLVEPTVRGSIKRSITNSNNRRKKDGSQPKNDRNNDRKNEKNNDENDPRTRNGEDREGDRDKGKDALEIDPSDQSISNASASGGAAAAGAAPPDAKPLCPLCEVRLYKNAQTGKYDCPNCLDSFEPDAVAWR